MHNVQLGLAEQIKVFCHPITGRILGFCPANSAPLLPKGTPYRSELLYHARDVERWVAKYRVQQEQDAERATYQQIQREARFRKSMRDAIQERNKHVSPANVALNNMLVRLQDEKYDAMMKAKCKPEIYGMNEASETPRSRDNAVEQFALESFKNQGDNRASGEVISREIAQLEHDIN